jgi:hypothetical protein
MKPSFYLISFLSGKICLTDVKTGSFCMTEKEKFLHGIDKSILWFDHDNFL